MPTCNAFSMTRRTLCRLHTTFESQEVAHMRTSIPIRPKEECEHRMPLAQSKLDTQTGLYLSSPQPMLISDRKSQMT